MQTKPKQTRSHLGAKRQTYPSRVDVSRVADATPEYNTRSLEAIPAGRDLALRRAASR